MLLLKSSDQFSAARLPLQVQSHVLNTSLQAHAHEFVEIALVLAGRSRHRTALGEGELRAGSLILLRPGAWHAFEEPKNLSVVNCLFGPELLRRELSPALEDPALRVALAAPLGLRGGEGAAANVLLLDLEAGARRRGLAHLRAIEIFRTSLRRPRARWRAWGI
jgi:AraC family L-rhamnose operon transcriptional activator RhaR